MKDEGQRVEDARCRVLRNSESWDATGPAEPQLEGGIKESATGAGHKTSRTARTVDDKTLNLKSEDSDS